MAGIDDLETLFTFGALGRLEDEELLARFVAGRGDVSSQAAFAAIVDRHGPMVRGLCRRVTGDSHAADDAFQATFLVLARRAAGVRVEGSLGRWLHGVGLRVARRARRDRRTIGLDGLDPIDPRPTIDPCERADLLRVVDEEVARLPPRYRSAVVLCLLEGLSQEQAARRLRCPIGTVQSRLHRARERLRSGLIRRGVAPAGLVAGMLPAVTSAAVPQSLVSAVSTAAARIAAGQALAGTVPAAVLALTASTIRSLMMRTFGTAAVVTLLGLTSLGTAFVMARPGSHPPAPSPAPVPSPIVETKPAADESLAEQLARIRDEFETKQRAYYEAIGEAKTKADREAVGKELNPDLPGTIRKIQELSSVDPKHPAVRDACIWLVERTADYEYQGSLEAEFAQAGNALLLGFGDDPDAVRVGLMLNNMPSAMRDRLLLGFFATAKGQEAKGLARLALADYLVQKAMLARGARKTEGRQTITYHGALDDDGQIRDIRQEESDASFAYRLHLKQCDPDYLSNEADRLYEEVIADYADIPYLRSNVREIANLLERDDPKLNGQPVTDEQRAEIAKHLANLPTLGQVAEGRLDDKHNLVVGKPAPGIDAADLSGEARKLSDYRGKVVVLVFWGSWCGPCMREVPHEKALVDKMQGRPFAMLGVNTDGDPELARATMAEAGITWPNWHDGEPGEGPITRLYHIRGYPTIYVIDAEGTIRSKKAIGESLDKLVETLVVEAEAKGAGQ